MQRRSFRVEGNGKGSDGILIDPAKLRQARLEASLTQEELGAGVITKQYVSRLEGGLNRPSLEILLHICQMTTKPLDFFVGHTDDANRLRRDLPLEIAQSGRTDRRRTRKTLPEKINTLTQDLRQAAKRAPTLYDRRVYHAAATALAAFAPLIAELEARKSIPRAI